MFQLRPKRIFYRIRFESVYFKAYIVKPPIPLHRTDARVGGVAAVCSPKSY